MIITSTTATPVSVAVADELSCTNTGEAAPPINGQTKMSEDWTWSELHKRIVTPMPKAEKLVEYAKWAPYYERDASDMRYLAPSTCVDQLWKYVSAMVEQAAERGRPLRVLDAGCGTGLCAVRFHTMGVGVNAGLHLIGLDYSLEMLGLADEKGLYEELVCADLNDKLVLEGGEVDFVVSAGLFVDGHCGPEIMPNMLDVLKEGGYASLTVRNKTFVSNEGKYLEFIEKSNCEVLENKVFRYIGVGEHYGNYIVVRKRVNVNLNLGKP